MGDLINGRMPEHIKAGLRCRVIGDVKCSDCAYYGTVLYEIGQREYECDDIDRDALALIERLEAAQPKWISVEDMIPPRERNILAVNGHGRIKMLALWKKEEKRWTWIEDSRFTHWNDITHWMPLPEPPEEDA